MLAAALRYVVYPRIRLLIVSLGGFDQAVNLRAGRRAFERVAEQPVFVPFTNGLTARSAVLLSMGKSRSLRNVPGDFNGCPNNRGLPPKALYEVTWGCVFSNPSAGGVVKQDNWALRRAAGRHPHTGLAGRVSIRLLEHLHPRFVAVDHRIIGKVFRQQ